MKKAISIAIVLCMLAAVVATVPTAYAAFTLPATYTTVDDLLDKDTNTGLDAYKGTPTIGEKNSEDKYVSVKDAAWDNALRLTLNDTYNGLITNGTIASGSDSDVYLLWDKDNLYILQDVRKIYKTAPGEGKATLEDVRNTTTVPAPYNGYETNMFHIILPRAIDNVGDAALRAKAYMVFVLPCLTDSTVASETVYEGVVRVRDNEYKANSGASGDKTLLSYSDTNAAGIKTFVERTDTGYMTETVIPWSFLDSTPDKAFAGLEDKTNQTIGIKIHHNNKYHINHELSDSSINADTAGFDPVTLLEAPAGDVGTTPEKITPDYAYWLDGTTGQFIVKDPKNGGQTYEIATAAQLLALSGILEDLSYSETTYGLAAVGLTSNSQKCKLTIGNTFVLTDDIDLNPGIANWDAVTKVLAGTMGLASSALPVNIFKSLDAFHGTLDGQGHTISGIYNPTATGGSNGNTGDFGGLVGSLRNGGIKNLVIDNGYVGDKDGGGFGGILGTVYSQKVNTKADNTASSANIVIENVYVGDNYYVNASQKTDSQSGGFMGGTYSNGTDGGVTTIYLTITNVVFKGNFTKAEKLVCGDFTGVIRYTSTGVTFETVMTDVLVKNSTGNNNIWYKTEGTANGSKTRVAFVDNSTIPEECAPYWTLTAKGVLPVELADMMSVTAHQTSAAVDGSYNVRILAEVASTKWKAVGFKVTVFDKTAGTTVEKSNLDNNTVYSSVMAENETATATALDIVEGEWFALITLDGFDATHEYEVSYTVVYTDAEANTFESPVVKSFAPVAYVAA